MTEMDDIESFLYPAMFYVDDKFKPPLFAAHMVFEVLDESSMTGVNRGYLVMKDTKEIYRFNGGYYEQDGEAFINGKLQKIMGAAVTTYQKKEVIQWIKDCEELQADREIFNTNPDKILLENGLYDIHENKIIMKDPNAFNTTYFPIIYDPDATCEKFIKFLQEILNEKDINIIQEMFGYCFYKPYVYQKAFMMVGEGANGKSTLLGILSTLLGDWNISSIPLQNLCKDRFTNIDLYGKYANICSDLSDRGLKQTGTFKMLTGGDYIRAEKKYKPNGILFRNTAKLIFSCNVIPECDDRSEAYHRRWIVIEFPNYFDENDEKTDPYIQDKLTTPEELSGIFNWGMEGLKRLIEKGKFSTHRTLEDVKEFMKEQQDTVNQFCIQCLTPGTHKDTIIKQDMYQYYLDFCDDLEKPTVAIIQFSMKLKQYAPRTLTEGQIKKGGKKVWHGVIYTLPEKEGKSDNTNRSTNEKLDIEQEDEDG